MKEHQWKDKEFFIDYEPAKRQKLNDSGGEIGGSMQAEDMVMDLSGDTASALLKSKQVRKWDAKKKKYVMMELDNEGRAKRQKLNDSGNFVKKDAKVKGRSYSDWQKKMRTTIQKPGEEESAAAGVSSGDQYMWVAGRRVKIGGEGVGLSTAKGAKGMVAKDELRNKDQIAKLRKEDERKGGVKEAKVAKVARKVVARQGTEQRQVQAKLQHLAMARMALSRARASLHWLPPKRPRAPRAKRIAQVKAKRSRVIVCGSIFDNTEYNT